MQPVGLEISIRHLWAKWFARVPVTDEQIAECVEAWLPCKSTMDIWSALETTRKKQRGPIANRLTVNDGDDLADIIRVYTTAVLRGRGKLPAPVTTQTL
jgi:hypothetical protein